MQTGELGYWAGVDWGHEKHAVCVVDDDGHVVTSFRAANSPQGLTMLVERLKALDSVAGVAIETSRHMLVDALLLAGFKVYAINPKLSHAWRKGWNVSEAKGDDRDAWVLGDGLRVHHGHLRAFEPEAAAARELALVCQDESRLIEDRTALVLRLEDTLHQYYPAALGWFNDWASQTAWDFILRFPSPQKLAQARKSTLCGFLRQHRIGLGPLWQERIEARKDATQWPCHEATGDAKSLLAVSLAKQLRALKPTLDAYRKRIEKLFSTHEDNAVFQSLPGAGAKLAPRLCAEIGTRRDRFDSASSLQQPSGTAPVTEQSGRHKTVHIRRACKKGFRNTLHQFAFQSINQSAWARAFYDLARERGQSHALALRNLANKWLKIIYRMWQNKEPYDEQRYVRQLIRKNSPIARRLERLTIGA